MRCPDEFGQYGASCSSPFNLPPTGSDDTLIIAIGIVAAIVVLALVAWRVSTWLYWQYHYRARRRGR